MAYFHYERLTVYEKYARSVDQMFERKKDFRNNNNNNNNNNIAIVKPFCAANVIRIFIILTVYYYYYYYYYYPVCHLYEGHLQLYTRTRPFLWKYIILQVFCIYSVCYELC